MTLPTQAEIRVTLHSPGEWVTHGDREVYAGSYTATLTGPAGRPDHLDELRHQIDSITLSRSLAPVQESSEEEDPEEDPTPPQSLQMPPPAVDVPESSRAREFAPANRMIGFLSPYARVAGEYSPWLYPEFLSPEEIARLGCAPMDWHKEMSLPHNEVAQSPEESHPVPMETAPLHPTPEVIVISDDDEPMPEPQPAEPVEAIGLLDDDEEEEMTDYVPLDPPPQVGLGYGLGLEMDYGPGIFAEDSDDSDSYHVAGVSDGESFSSVGTGYSWVR